MLPDAAGSRSAGMTVTVSDCCANKADVAEPQSCISRFLHLQKEARPVNETDIEKNDQQAHIAVSENISPNASALPGRRRTSGRSDHSRGLGSPTTNAGECLERWQTNWAGPLRAVERKGARDPLDPGHRSLLSDAARASEIPSFLLQSEVPSAGDESACPAGWKSRGRWLNYYGRHSPGHRRRGLYRIELRPAVD